MLHPRSRVRADGIASIRIPDLVPADLDAGRSQQVHCLVGLCIRARGQAVIVDIVTKNLNCTATGSHNATRRA